MTRTATPHAPCSLKYRPAPDRPGIFQLVDDGEGVWADGIPNEAAARLFAASPKLLLNYAELLAEAYVRFNDCWDLGWSASEVAELAETDDTLDDDYPDMTAHAAWLHELQEFYDGLNPFSERSMFTQLSLL